MSRSRRADFVIGEPVRETFRHVTLDAWATTKEFKDSFENLNGGEEKDKEKERDEEGEAAEAGEKKEKKRRDTKNERKAKKKSKKKDKQEEIRVQHSSFKHIPKDEKELEKEVQEFYKEQKSRSSSISKEKKSKKKQKEEEIVIAVPDPTSFIKVTNEVDEKKYKASPGSFTVVSSTGAGQARIASMNPANQSKQQKMLIKGVNYFEYTSNCFNEANERTNLIEESGKSGLWSVGMSMSALRNQSRQTLEDPQTEDRKQCPLGSDCTNPDPTHFLMYRHTQVELTREEMVKHLYKEVVDKKGESAFIEQQTRLPCPKGANCKSLDPNHFIMFEHTHAPQEELKLDRAATVQDLLAERKLMCSELKKSSSAAEFRDMRARRPHKGETPIGSSGGLSIRKKKKKKKKKKDKKKFILDVVLIGARHLDIGDKVVAPICFVNMGGTVQTFSTQPGTVHDPMWNCDLTFVYNLEENEEQQENQHLTISVFNKLKRKKMDVVGSVAVDPSGLEEGVVYDIWLDLKRESFSASKEKEKFILRNVWGWNGANRSAIWSDNGLVDVCGFVHLRVQKHSNPKKGMLAAYGTPMKHIPLRVEVGDIILFNAQTSLTKQAVHVATGSMWDHLAMVVRLPEEEEGLLLFEATRDGVAVYRLDARLDFYRNDTILGFRRLELKRTKAMIKTMADFVEEVNGKPYNSNFVEIVKAQWGNNQKDTLNCYFCSQLVAAAYQKMGLLDPEIPATNYLPAHFEPYDNTKLSSKRLNLLKGNLGDVLIIPRKEKTKKKDRGDEL